MQYFQFFSYSVEEWNYCILSPKKNVQDLFFFCLLPFMLDSEFTEEDTRIARNTAVCMGFVFTAKMENISGSYSYAGLP